MHPLQAKETQKHSKILLTPNFKLNLRSSVQSCMWLGPIWMQNGKCTAGCGILMCHDCETSVLVSVVKPLASLCCPGSLLRKDHWVRDNSPSASCAKACRASPSCSAPQSLVLVTGTKQQSHAAAESWSRFALKQNSVCETEDRLNDSSRIQSCRFMTAKDWRNEERRFPFLIYF